VKYNDLDQETLPKYSWNSGKWGFEVEIRKNKNEDYENEQKNVFIEEEFIPKEVQDHLLQFSKQDEDFEWRIAKDKVVQTIRIMLNQVGNKGLVFHSLRHGRATHLKARCGFGMEKLQMVGRWHSKGALRCYLHK